MNTTTRNEEKTMKHGKTMTISVDSAESHRRGAHRASVTARVTISPVKWGDKVLGRGGISVPTRGGIEAHSTALDPRDGAMVVLVSWTHSAKRAADAMDEGTLLSTVASLSDADPDLGDAKRIEALVRECVEAALVNGEIERRADILAGYVRGAAEHVVSHVRGEARKLIDFDARLKALEAELSEAAAKLLDDVTPTDAIEAVVPEGMHRKYVETAADAIASEWGDVRKAATASPGPFGLNGMNIGHADIDRIEEALRERL